MMPSHGCGRPVRWVVIAGDTVAVEPHTHGTIEVPTNPRHMLAFNLAHDQAPRLGYLRYRRHICPESPSTPRYRSAA